ncbi:hypothetical protein FisN_37Lh024 [Fistulifera solaris]|uniref:Nuclear pore complex protein Nup205 n=1 Tax=Fistulifera solaris TaxID=1519565 RepID=A0A1Z5K0X8_FISSO|nr:hypothetical protein FisN_37Lh024 [Fistulifera solaris]|eukprot:GAX19756.1 hypothetical protein FisN_37Lh024 [Fistulifera solaris]
MAFSFNAGDASTNAGGFNFGAGTPAPATGGGFSFASTPSASQSSAFASTNTSTPQQPTTTTTTTTSTNYVVASDFHKVFPGMTLAPQLMAILSDNFASVHVQQELLELLPECYEWLLKIEVPTMIPANLTLRQQMEQQQHVQLSDGQIAPLNKKLLQQIKSLADDLHLAEVDAIALLQHAGLDHVRHELQEGGPLVVPVSATATPIVDNVAWAARELYFLQRRVQFQSLLQLWQWRAGAVVATSCERILRATDPLLENELIPRMIEFVRQATTRIGQWMVEVSKLEEEDKRRELNYAKLHLQQLVEERQCVVECLFFIAYHTQMTCQEVVDMVDVIGQLTNRDGPNGGLPILDPFRDVPDVHITTGLATWGPTTTVLKKREDWEKEWVEHAWTSGKAPLSQCVAVLVVAVMAALDTKTLLMDRQRHGPNAFGVGNALLPFGSTSLEGIRDLNQRFSQEAQENWERKDILGLLMLAHAMLLRSCPALLSSPRAGSLSPLAGTTDLKKLWRECIDAPRSFKSITYARLSLIPTLHVPLSLFSNSSCDVSDFLLSTLSDFAAHYLDTLSMSGGWPISREKWMQEAKEDLKIRQVYEEQQRQFAYQFNTSWGVSQQSNMSETIDLLQRPDCMDDLIAFASALCSLKPHYAMKFWALEEADGDSQHQLVRSRTLRDLKDQQIGDDSLRASYISFLAGLALASAYDGKIDGAATVFEMLLDERCQSPDDTMTWTSVVQILKWYATQLGSETSSSGQAGTSRTQTRSGTAYYYDDDYSTRPQYQRAAAVATSAKDRELDEDNIYFLLANLSLITNVVARHPVARLRLLQVGAPSHSSDGSEVVKQDSTLQVMFDLLVKAVTPEVRGKIFSTISELINCDGLDGDNDTQMNDFVRECWKLVEEYQVLPIYLLEQYPSLSSSETSEIPHFSFPSCSMSLVGSSQRKSWIPADPRYSILYEMEYVEAATGVYPSTKGFLDMLKSLIKSGICPNDLGSVWRSRTGCTPYIEYVVDYILPRLSRPFQGFPLLPFRSSNDKLSITVRACEIVKEALSNYLIAEAIGDTYELCLLKAKAVLGIDNLADSVVTQPRMTDGPLDYLRDFGLLLSGTSNSVEGSKLNNAKVEIGAPIIEPAQTFKAGFPPTKSMGLTILSSILSLTDATLFETLVLLTRDLAESFPGSTASDQFSAAAALYIATPPSFLSSKDGSRVSNAPFSEYNALEALRPSLSSCSVSRTLKYRQRLEVAILQILCAALVREEALIALKNSAKRKISVFSILAFEANGQRYSNVKERDLHLTQLSKHIESVDMRSSFLLDLIAMSSVSTKLDEIYRVQRASAATAIIFYVQRSLGSLKDTDLLVRRRDGRNGLLARAFASQLLCSSELLPNEAASELIEVILGTLVKELRLIKQSANASFLLALLGLPEDMSTDLLIFKKSGQQRIGDCFDAILQLIERQCFEQYVEHFFLGSMCYEIMYRLCSFNAASFSQVAASYAVQRLRDVDFWPQQLKVGLLSASEVASSNNAQSLYKVHALSWIMKGAAAELGVICGLGKPSSGSSVTRNTDQYSRFMRRVFDINFFANILDVLPLEKMPLDHSLSPPSESNIRSSKVMINGSPDVVDGYELVDGKKLCKSANVSSGSIEENSLCRWSEQWNFHVMKDCASAHMGNALYMLVGCASSTAKVDVYPAYESASWLQLLSAMLDRMSTNSLHCGHPFDSVYYTTASRNLALAMFMASELVRSNDSHDFSSIAYTCKQISRLIACSDEDRGSGPGRGRKAERTAILATSLSQLLSLLPANQMRDHIEDIRNAAIVLAGLATEQSLGNILSSECLASRACLMQIFRMHFDDHENFYRLVLTYSTRSHAGGLVVDLISPVRTLDGSIIPLLLVIAQTRGGSDLLIQRGILDALLDAARKYSAEESTFLASHSATAAYGNKDIVTPSFFVDHVRLMIAILSNQSDSGLKKASDISDRLSTILYTYQPLIERLVSSFPIDGDKLRVVIQCIAKIYVSSARQNAINSQSLVYTKRDARYAIEAKVVDLIMHMTENPLPTSIQKPLPVILEKSEDLNVTSFVTSKNLSKTWWDSLGVIASDIVKICNLASLGVKTIRDGLLVLRHSQILVREISIRSLSRALCRCLDAAKWAEFHAASTAADQAFAFRSAVLELTEDIMAFTHSRVRQLKADQMFDAADAQILRAALDHVALDAQQGKFLSGFPVDENSADLTPDLAKALRQETDLYC